MVEVDHATHAELIDSTKLTAPLRAHGRIQALDVLRGVAVAGILLANVQVNTDPTSLRLPSEVSSAP